VTPNAKLTLPATGLSFGAGDFTWEAWLKVQPKTDWRFVIHPGEWHSLNVTVQPGNVLCRFATTPPSPGDQDHVSAEHVLEPGHWSHLACVRSGSSLRMYVNGVLRASGRTELAMAVPVEADAMLGPDLEVGPLMLGPTRISRVARYHASFVPAIRFTADDDTALLYLMRQRPSSTTIIDEADGDNSATILGGVLDGAGDTPCAAFGLR
jgi:hypothetical protein